MSISVPGAERWKDVKALFIALHDLDAAAREDALRNSGADPEVAAAVRKLLEAATSVGERFERPALAALEGEPPGAQSWRDAPSLEGRRLGPYYIIRRIGQGGMGMVYEGVRNDHGFSQRVAVKTLWRGADSVVLAQRFRSERSILASLNHPNIARLIDGGSTVEGTPYLTMEYVDGIAIDTYCDAHMLRLPARLDLFRQICAAVQHAHNNLIVHRDLKPSNILVTRDGHVKLLDFGVAKLLDDHRPEGTLTHDGLAPLTTAYASPEQLRGEKLSTSSDLYTLGALLYLLLAGKPPFTLGAVSPFQALIERDVVVPPSASATDHAALSRGFGSAPDLSSALRGDLDAITLTALRETPDGRYATADALSQDVHRYLRGERILARPDTLGYRARTFVRRRRAFVGGAAIAMAALISGSVIALRQAGVARAEAARAERIASFVTRMYGTPDAHTGSSIMRFGPRGSIAAVLESALPRVATEFPDDPGVRARLYTTLGASFVAESHLRIARLALDSARALARLAYGSRSDAFAEASVDAANAAIHSSPPHVAAALLRDAQMALQGREASSAELQGRVLATAATLNYLNGNVLLARRDASDGIAWELRRTRAPTTTRAWSTRILCGTALMQGAARVADALCAHSIQIMDSLGGEFSLERIDALEQRASALELMGRLDSAESLLRMGLAAAREGYGERSREVAIFQSALALHVRRHGDVATARAMADSAANIMDGIPDANGPARLAAMRGKYSQLLADNRPYSADSTATSLLERIRTAETPPATAVAAEMAAVASFYHGDFRRSEARLRFALASYPGADVHELIPQRILSALAITLEREGRRVAADSIATLLLPANAAAVRRARSLAGR